MRYNSRCIKSLFRNFTNWFKLDEKTRIKKSTINSIIDRLYHCINVARPMSFSYSGRTELDDLLVRYRDYCCQQNGKTKPKSKSKKLKFAKEIIHTIMQHEKISENIESAVATALKLGHIKILQILVNKENLNIFAVSDGDNLFHRAVDTRKLDIVRIIYQTAQKACASKPQKEQEQILSQFVNHLDGSDHTPYIRACCLGLKNKKLFEILINECKVDITINAHSGMHGSDYIEENDQLQEWLRKLELDACEN